jgi:hypothetical protein
MIRMPPSPFDTFWWQALLISAPAGGILLWLPEER